MKFSYKDNYYLDVLSIKTDHGVEVNVTFFEGDAEDFYVDSYCIPIYGDTLDGIFFVIDGSFVSARSVVESAVNQYPAIKAEVEQERADEEAHEREMSSLEKTGRI